jgi:restriction system protein
MAVWLVRAGRHGEREETALKHGIAVIGWEELGDLSLVKSREELQQLCEATYPGASPNKITNHVGQVWAFRERIQTGDIIILPLKTLGTIAVGKVTGPYRYRTDLGDEPISTRPVNWVQKALPRSNFKQDLLWSLGSAMTVCQIQRNNAEQRVQAVLAGKPDSGFAVGPPGTTGNGDPEEVIDLDQQARDQIRQYVEENFKRHELARLVDCILQAQGYRTQRSSPGPDGGVDVIAGHGPLGFDPPRLCVQVKSGTTPMDVKVMRELRGVMKSFGAEQGVLVSWAGFRGSVTDEARQLFFEIRLWDSDQVLKALFDNYDRLSAELQAEIPLKRIWALVPQE